MRVFTGQSAHITAAGLAKVDTLIGNGIDRVDHIRRCLFSDHCELFGRATGALLEDGFERRALQRAE